jgi:hypothetical protein
MVDHPGHPDRLGVPCSYHGIEHGCCLGLDARVARRRSALRSPHLLVIVVVVVDARLSVLRSSGPRVVAAVGRALCSLASPGGGAALVRIVTYGRMANK